MDSSISADTDDAHAEDSSLLAPGQRLGSGPQRPSLLQLFARGLGLRSPLRTPPHSPRDAPAPASADPEPRSRSPGGPGPVVVASSAGGASQSSQSSLAAETLEALARAVREADAIAAAAVADASAAPAVVADERSAPAAALPATAPPLPVPQRGLREVVVALIQPGEASQSDRRYTDPALSLYVGSAAPRDAPAPASADPEPRSRSPGGPGPVVVASSAGGASQSSQSSLAAETLEALARAVREADAIAAAAVADASAAPAVVADERSAPAAALPATAPPLPVPQRGLREVVVALIQPGEASQSDRRYTDPALSLYVGSAAFRARANAGQRERPGSAPASPSSPASAAALWGDFFLHLAASLRTLERHAGVVYAVCPPGALAGLRRSSVVRWQTLALATTREADAVAVCRLAGPGATLLQLVVLEGAWRLPLRPGCSGLPLVCLEPLADFDVALCGGPGDAGGPTGAIRFATLVQRHGPLPAVVPQPSDTLERVVLDACKLLDAGDVAMACARLAAGQRQHEASGMGDPLAFTAGLVARALYDAWPALWARPPPAAAELVLRVFSGSERGKSDAADRALQLSGANGTSQALLFAAGATMLSAGESATKGLQLLFAAHAGGCVLATAFLATAYERGEGVAKDPKQAASLYEEAAPRGHAQALCTIAVAQHASPDAREPTQTVRRLSVAAALGSVTAMAHLSPFVLKGDLVEQDASEGLRLARVAADEGDAHGQYLMGLAYKKGESGVRKDLPAAMRMYRKAAEQGHAAAMCNLGVCLWTGSGGPDDSAEAARLLRRSAELGYVLAEYNLALLYDVGDGVKADPAEAARLFVSAASKGNPAACYRAGCCYRDGNGVPKNAELAERYLRTAADMGFGGAAKALQSLAR
eukprot:m51a1_g4412 hypothetical protein (886) ;mRNA; r:446666-449766